MTMNKYQQHKRGDLIKYFNNDLFIVIKTWMGEYNNEMEHPLMDLYDIQQMRIIVGISNTSALFKKLE